MRVFSSIFRALRLSGSDFSETEREAELREEVADLRKRLERVELLILPDIYDEDTTP